MPRGGGGLSHPAGDLPPGRRPGKPAPGHNPQQRRPHRAHARLGGEARRRTRKGEPVRVHLQERLAQQRAQPGQGLQRQGHGGKERGGAFRPGLHAALPAAAGGGGGASQRRQAARDLHRADLHAEALAGDHGLRPEHEKPRGLPHPPQAARALPQPGACQADGQARGRGQADADRRGPPPTTRGCSSRRCA